MKCPECGFDNIDGMKFCGECGSKMEVVCPECGFSNPLSHKFCGDCGHNLTKPASPPPKELTFEEKLDKIQKYLPQRLSEKILSQRGKIEGERKQVTVMFCDLEGFTPLVEKIGADEAYTIMDQVYELLIHAVHDYEGTVNEMTGDGIMALFGAPIALEDAPQRAIRSSLAVQREMARFNDKLRQEGKEIPPLKMRVGIHSGPVVVGTLGNDLRVEFKAVGDTVNLASRMENLAEPGATYITEDTFKLTEGIFRCEALGAKEIKGIHEPVNAYRVITTSSQRTRFDVNAERGLTPLVGRERELEILLDGFEMVKSGRGQIFSIVAEAGAGKSRLLYEFRKSITNEDVSILEGQCLSFARSISFRPIIEITKAGFEIEETDTQEQIKQKFRDGLNLIKVDKSQNLPYLLELFDIKDDSMELPVNVPEVTKERIIEALQLIILKRSEVKPLVVIVEDLHWLDKNSEDLLRELMSGISGSRIQLIFSYRPEYEESWSRKSNYNQLNLNRFSSRESIDMVSKFLSIEEIDENLADLILEKTEGIPYFIEEFIKLLIDLKYIEKKGNRYELIKTFESLNIPSSIQDLLTARIDTLPEGAKEILQAGSVIGREFTLELLNSVIGIEGQNLKPHLEALVDSELIYERGIFPDKVYIFKHALTRDVTYDSLIIRRKKQIHHDVGSSIEEIFNESIDAYYGVLCDHFMLSEDYEKGEKYSVLAARYATNKFLRNDAINYRKKRVHCIERQTESPENVEKRIRARVGLGALLTAQDHFAEAKETVDPIINLALKYDLRKQQPRIYFILGGYYFAREEFSEGNSHFKRALSIAEEIADHFVLSTANYYLGIICWYNNEFKEADKYWNQSMQYSIPEYDNAINTFKAFTSFYTFNLQRVKQHTDKAVEFITEDNTFENCVAHMAIVASHIALRSFQEAEKIGNLVLDFSIKTDQLLWVQSIYFMFITLYYETEDYLKVKVVSEKAVSFTEKRGILKSYSKLAKIFLFRVVRLESKNAGKMDIMDFEYLQTLYQEIRLPLHKGIGARIISEIYRDDNDPDWAEAERWLEKAMGHDTRFGNRFYFMLDLISYSRLFEKQNNLTQARKQMNKAIDIMKECGADGWVERYEKELGELN